MVSGSNSLTITAFKTDKLFQLLGDFLLMVLLFFCTTNVLFNFPLDKIMMVLVCGGILILNPQKTVFSAKEFSVIISIFVIASLSSLANLVLFPMIFFPVVGFIFSITVSRFSNIILHTMYYALLLHIILGIIFLVLAYAGLPNPFVYSLLGKGFNFLFSERGFTATVQTFGTLCLTWLLIYFLRRDLGINTKADKLFFIINCIAVIGTLNRSTFLFWMILLFLKERKLLITIIVGVCVVSIRFWHQILGFLTVSSSLTARTELLQGFNLSFVQSHSLLVYVFGKGTDQLPKNVLNKVKWSYRTDIENGYAMLLHTYGALGLIFYISVCVYLISMFIKLKKWSEVFILIYFLFIAPYFTQEFVSISFYFLLAVMLFIYNLSKEKNTIAQTVSISG